ncbi:phosphonate C-P lyase system protein PhnG [Paracoccus siganidrum]|uniref:Phosphonate C-P lyase system protein PhnG n=1 Tax=Paracoccus siganidrum TaxID=1276757 RepID=A0A419A7B1_9RHOB|nr:phosphonate C-P lyase system protein PhnG [Paracoccus siganidrum]RJL16369.1 phosphonate C-P lyase system protein PhnG [Paracoccus siganidrum]RMC39651.1 phosphonate C-P lyase system protein PhnG [Paracoccus siganidrum]
MNIPLPPDDARRRDWMAILAKAPPARLAALMPDLPAHDLLRPPQIGTVMVQGRTGGTGAPFNLGEMTVTRASVRLGTGEVGHAMVQGRDKGHAARAAITDALMQGDAAARIEAEILDPLRREAEARRRTRAAKAAATRVEFFTLVRGEDQ